jgi:hypothetical protein
MLSYQAEHFLNSNYFLVDLSFKRVQGNIKELEFNGYDENHDSSKIATNNFFSFKFCELTHKICL